MYGHGPEIAAALEKWKAEAMREILEDVAAAQAAQKDRHA